MKKPFFLLFIFSLLLCVSCRADDPNDEIEVEDIFHAEKDREFDDGSHIVFPELNNHLITDLELLCKIWGFLKYHHPEVGKGNYNWDYELFRILPKYMQVRNTEERDKTLLEWINKYGTIPACVTCRETPVDAFIKPNLLWAENSNMNNALKSKIKEIYQNRHQGDHYYLRMTLTGNPEFLHENPYNFYIPDAGFRLLALFRYWNMICYFFPSKYLTDKNWDDILPEYLPLFISANNRLEYEMAALQVIGEINDTHAFFIGGVEIQKSRGYYFPPFLVKFIAGKLVVTEYYNPEQMETYSIKIGDVITYINGETVASIIESRKKYYPASNEAARLRTMSINMLRSTQNTINIQTEQTGQQTIPLYRMIDMSVSGSNNASNDEKCYKFLDGNIGYVTLESITNDDIPEIKRSFIDTKGIIIDIRNYPSAFTPFTLAPYFVSKSTPFAKFSGGNVNNPGEFTFIAGNNIPKDNVTYQGKLIVIVNETTQSSAEYQSMAFQAGDNTTIIGSTTAGADGNVSYINLPGGLQTVISGIGVYYPDGTETQRIGIVPDVWVEPTIEGIREGRDELLEMAVNLINEEK